MLYVGLSQVYSLMLTVSRSCEDSVIDNYMLGSSAWVLFPRVNPLLNHTEGPGAGPPVVLHTVQKSTCISSRGASTALDLILLVQR